MATDSIDPTGDTAPGDDTFEAALLDWIRRQGIEGPRRLVRVDEEEALISKFEPGFAVRLHELLRLVPDLFDEATVVANTERGMASMPDESRVSAWHAAMHEALARAGEQHGIPDLRLAEVRTGIDSVRAVLEVILWSEPLCGDVYEPQSGEAEAYREGFLALEDGRDTFTRYYGMFDGRAVRNHCPGAAFARVLLAQAWRACTGTPAPADQAAGLTARSQPVTDQVAL